MSLAPLIEALPSYARDLGQNLGVLEAETILTDQQKWGTFVASAHAVATPAVVQAIETAATQAGLSAEAMTAAKAAAAIMGMNNIYFRSLHMLHNKEYRHLPARLRMRAITEPGVDKTDFELWELAVSAIHGCDECLNVHEPALKARGASPLQIQTVLRIAAVVHAVSRAMAGVAAEE